MKLLIIVLTSLLLTGFTIETPETIRETKKAEKRWKKEVDRRFDLDELHRFLVKTVEKKPTLNEIDLTRAKIGEAWTFESMSLSSGDWVFTYNSRERIFEFTYTYDDMKFIGLRCRRESKKKFHFIESYLDQWYILSVKYETKPNNSLQATAAKRSLLSPRYTPRLSSLNSSAHCDPMQINHPRNSNDRSGLVA